MQNLKISVIVLTYKEFSHLEDNLRSIMKQNYDNYEVLIQDDGSDNYDAADIKSIVSRMEHPERIIISSNERNLGTVRNLNAAIKKAKGEIIVPLSQDDSFVGNDILMGIEQFFCQTKCNICVAKRQGILSQNVFPSVREIKYLEEYNKKKLWLRLACANFISGSVLYFRKEFIQRCGFFDENYTLIEDYPFVMRTVLSDERIRFLDLITITYGENGISSKKLSNVYLRDKSLLFKSLLAESQSLLHSHLCKTYLEYRLYEIENMLVGKRRHSLRFFRIYVFLRYARIEARIYNRTVTESLFSLLWRSEKKYCKYNSN